MFRGAASGLPSLQANTRVSGWCCACVCSPMVQHLLLTSQLTLLKSHISLQASQGCRSRRNDSGLGKGCVCVHACTCLCHWVPWCTDSNLYCHGLAPLIRHLWPTPSRSLICRRVTGTFSDDATLQCVLLSCGAADTFSTAVPLHVVPLQCLMRWSEAAHKYGCKHGQNLFPMIVLKSCPSCLL